MANNKQLNFSHPSFQTAVSQYQSGNLQLAETLLKMMPDNSAALHLLAVIFCRQGHYEFALDPLERAIEIESDVTDYHYQLGIAYAQLKRWNDAVNCFRKAVKLSPSLTSAHNNIGSMLRELHQLDDAANAFQRAIHLKSDYLLAHHNLGNLYCEQKKFLLAEQCFRNALALNPGYVDAHHGLAKVLENQGKVNEAVACYLALLASGDHTVSTYNNLGNIYAQQDQYDEAVALFAKALDIDPKSAETYCNLGFTYVMQGKLGDAIETLGRAIRLKPDLAMTHLNLSGALGSLSRYEEAIALLRSFMAINPNDFEIHSNLLFLSQFVDSLTPSNLFNEHLQFSERFEMPYKGLWRSHDNSQNPRKRLKIAYISADFRSHAVATFIEPVLAKHDKSEFEVYCYYNHPRHDAVTVRIQSFADHWVPCLNLSDDQLAERIRQDGIDILIDLSGHTGGNRLLTFSRKPAPVQMTYLGYPGTSGLSAMDYRITDCYADPKGAEEYYSEKLIRLPDSLCCYQPVVDMPEVSPLPALANGYITFGSFNNGNKIDQHAIALWARILVALPTSRLLMATIPEGDRRVWIAKRFEEEGVASNRIDFYGKLPAREFHLLFQKVDIALDPLLITGGTTTCESLWMGVPVIVLVGQRFIHRVGYSFLSSAGLSHFGVLTKEEYVRIALETAADIPRLAKLRDSMRAQIATSPLMDQTRFTLNIENAYRQAWVTWCNSPEQ
ncbi:MAG: tetratricopeptide repeat protein [Undibacterium sp.]|uniref:O-linked N-acetylglucosamine transferase, SPINDLY family protein n=1 Tax=Undibacterium sp. TaxID=1914977 RepID=UPI00271FD170|nr:tetratricopeptide repeat protein [Undibacterium sp.]MDO8653796.1 tetratricopeptide repeat protein [Undibacterium sp.]